MRSSEAARLGSRPEDYDRFGLDRDEVLPRENGMRTTGEPGTYEWWYFDAQLRNGATLVVVFHTKPTQAFDGPLAPYVSITYDKPAEESFEHRIQVDPDQFEAAETICDVRLGQNSWRKEPAEWAPNLERAGLYGHDLWIKDDSLEIELALFAQAPIWRPKSGHFLFGDSDYFAWLAAVPHGEVTGHITFDGRHRSLSGVGYHDHNWGNAHPGKLMRGWQWHRGSAGRTAMVAAQLYPLESYGTEAIPVFMLSQNGRLVTDNPCRVSITANDQEGTTSYVYGDRDETHDFTFWQRQCIAERPLTRDIGCAAIPGVIEANTLYQRFSGSTLYYQAAIGVGMEEGLHLESG